MEDIEGGIGIGVNTKVIARIMKDLCIKPDRIEALQGILVDAMKHQTDNPADDLERFIAQTNKANEIAFLSFMCGLGVGAYSAISEMEIPNLIKRSMIVGAEHSDKIKELVNMENGTAPGATATPVKKKDEKPEDIMYG